MSSSDSSSSGESFWLGDWDQPGNVVDTLGIKNPIVYNNEERSLRSKFTFDQYHKEFNDVRIFQMQSRERFQSLKSLLKFPTVPFYSTIFSCFNKSEDRFRAERFIQRRFCLNSCYWDPTICFLEDSHSGSLQDLMKQEFLNLYNPAFERQFPKEEKTCQLVYDPKGLYPPNLNKFIAELGISSVLTFKDGKAVNFDYLTRQLRNLESPHYFFEEKKFHDVIEALLDSTKIKVQNQKSVMQNKYHKSYKCTDLISRPILSLMMWGPQSSNKLPFMSQSCKFETDPDHSFIVDGHLHNCKNYTDKHYWMFTHGEDVDCNQSDLEYLTGPAMTESLTIIYPCNKGKCALDCTCNLCMNTKKAICDLNDHKKHIHDFEKDCPVQQVSQCQEHWISHPFNFDEDEDILVEKNIFFHNQKLVDQPRSHAVDVIKLTGIKRSCLKCRRDVHDHFQKHLDFHLQCKLCLFQLLSLDDSEFWQKVCNICGKKIVPFSSQKMKRHKKAHEETEVIECNVCSKEFSIQSSFNRHMREQHGMEMDRRCGEDEFDENSSFDGETDEDENETFVEENFLAPIGPEYSCPQCGKHFSQKRYVESHVKTFHKDDCPFQCEDCGKRYKYHGALKRHRQSVHERTGENSIVISFGQQKQHNCSICSKVFKRKDLLNKHLVTHDKSKEKFSCEECGKLYGRRDNLLEHRKHHHPNFEKNHICPLCGKQFSNKFNLKTHQSSVHD